MLAIVPVIGPLLLIALTGFIAARRGVLTGEQVMGLGRFLVVIAIPAVLVLSISRLPVSGVLGGSFMLLYAGIATTLVALAWLIGRHALAASRTEATTMALGVAIPNNIIIGFPLSQQMFGEASLPLFVAVILVENILLLPLALFMFEGASHAGRITTGSALGVGKRVLGNPITLAVVLGITLSLLAIPLPALLASTLELLGAAVSGMALFYVGASLAGTRPGQLSGKVCSSVFLRIVGGPALALLVVSLGPDLDPMERACLVLFCASPSFTILPAIASAYGTQRLGASIQVSGTILAALSLPIVLSYIL